MSPQLIVADIKRSIKFYTIKLGFSLEFNYEDFYAGVSKDGYTIHLKLGKPSAEERKNRRDNEHLDLVFSVDNIEALYKEISVNAIEIIQSLRSMPYGKEFYIADPDGYIIGFLE
ncbi:VOC family protein [Mucilaginibacter sp. BT774]|uniref:VOC family protein n=1 Tax=Mucilaginibacter sp. BT774 TaxID=3062276 RepID=UPI0026768D99|nr:VOC family protein [Mucilaginibacter sp. BT774]